MRLEPKHYVESFADAKRVLLILSSSKTSEQISHRIEPLLNLQNLFGFKLLIKMHPGSLFAINELRDAVSTSDVELYKEEKIEAIDFDFAFIEQSTAALDVACLGTPTLLLTSLLTAIFPNTKKCCLPQVILTSC